MKFVIVAVIVLFAFWLFGWLKKRGAYYNQAERELQRMEFDSSLVDKKYGRGKYHASLEYMRKHGLTPEEAAQAIAADLSGEYNEFLEIISTEQGMNGVSDPSQNGELLQSDLLAEKIRSTYSHSVQLAETLAGTPIPKSKDIQSVQEFGMLIASFVASLKTNMGVQIEGGSIGKTLTDAMERRDFDTIAEIQNSVMEKVHELSGEDRSDYVFQLFWPQIFNGLSAGS